MRVARGQRGFARERMIYSEQEELQYLILDAKGSRNYPRNPIWFRPPFLGRLEQELDCTEIWFVMSERLWRQHSVPIILHKMALLISTTSCTKLYYYLPALSSSFSLSLLPSFDIYYASSMGATELNFSTVSHDFWFQTNELNSGQMTAP